MWWGELGGIRGRGVYSLKQILYLEKVEGLDEEVAEEEEEVAAA